MNANLRAVVECLLTAHYSEREIVDYLEGAYGLTLEEALDAVQETAGGLGLGSRLRPRDRELSE